MKNKSISVVLIAMFAASMISLMSPVCAYDSTNPYVVYLIAGQQYYAGRVEVWTDSTYLHVNIVAEGGWTLTGTAVAVATSLGGIPQKNGNPLPGQFAYKTNPALIPLNGWTAGTTLYIAVHADVEGLPGSYWCAFAETAWASPWLSRSEFPGSNWALYFTYTV